MITILLTIPKETHYLHPTLLSQRSLQLCAAMLFYFRECEGHCMIVVVVDQRGPQNTNPLRFPVAAHAFSKTSDARLRRSCGAIRHFSPPPLAHQHVLSGQCLLLFLGHPFRGARDPRHPLFQRVVVWRSAEGQHEAACCMLVAVYSHTGPRLAPLYAHNSPHRTVHISQRRRC